MQRKARVAALTALSTLALGAAQLADDGPDEDAVGTAVRRALPYLAQQTDAWIGEHGCTSCHQVPISIWAMNESRVRGFEVDERLPEWNRWSLEFISVAEDAEDPEASAREKTDEIWQLILAGAGADSAAGASAERERLRGMLHEARLEDGSWEAQGQLTYQDRPQAETFEATGLWSLHALRAYGEDVEGASFEVKQESTTTEHLALRWRDARARKADGEDELLQRLLAAQNGDGGWGWPLDATSDALATGMVLYLLEGTRIDPVPKAIERARAFLIETQGEDGVWPVPSTLEREKRAVTVVANDWGTAWAVIGLLRTQTE